MSGVGWGGRNSLSILQVHYLSQHCSTLRRHNEEVCDARTPAGCPLGLTRRPGYSDSGWNAPKTLNLKIIDLQYLSPELLSLPRPPLGPGKLKENVANGVVLSSPQTATEHQAQRDLTAFDKRNVFQHIFISACFLFAHL